MNRKASMVAMVVSGVVALGGNRGARIAFAVALAVALIAAHHGHASANFRNHGG